MYADFSYVLLSKKCIVNNKFLFILIPDVTVIYVFRTNPVGFLFSLKDSYRKIISYKVV